MERNYMLEQMLTFPTLLGQVFPTLNEAASTLVPDEVLQNLDMIYIYGSGDSLNAAACAAQAFTECSGIPTFAINALQASRYLPPTLTPEQAVRTLTICISNSGEASRSAEATYALAQAGCHTMAITARPLSQVGRAVDYVLQSQAPAAEPTPIPVPGTRSFAVALMGLYLLAIHFGRRRERLSERMADAMLAELDSLKDILAETFASGEAMLREFAALCSQTQRMEFIGSGPNRGACDFGVSKVLEGIGYSVLSQDLEEYAHQTFFSLNPDRLPTVVVIPGQCRALVRADEILTVLRHQGRPILVLTDDASVVEQHPGVRCLCLSHPVSENLSPMIYASLLSLMTAMMDLLPGDIYMHGHEGPYNEDNLPTVRESKVLK